MRIIPNPEEVFSETEFTCDICNAPMVLTKTVGTKESGKKYRQRWFKCTICDYEKKINGSGYHQEHLVPLIIKRQLKKQDLSSPKRT